MPNALFGFRTWTYETKTGLPVKLTKPMVFNRDGKNQKERAVQRNPMTHVLWYNNKRAFLSSGSDGSTSCTSVCPPLTLLPHFFPLHNAYVFLIKHSNGRGSVG